jgi:hypothetical protein
MNLSTPNFDLQCKIDSLFELRSLLRVVNNDSGLRLVRRNYKFSVTLWITLLMNYVFSNIMLTVHMNY